MCSSCPFILYWVLSVFSEHLLGAGGWAGGSRGDRERRGGQVLQDLVSCREDLGFNPREVGALEGCGQRGDRT